MTAIQSCAGGWCTRRDHCANYHAASPDQQPAERLCPPGQDGAGPQLIETDMARRIPESLIAEIRATLRTEGITIAEIMEAVGQHPENVRAGIAALAARGEAFKARVPATNRAHHQVAVYLDAASAERAQADAVKLTAEKRAAYHQARAAQRLQARHEQGRSLSARAMAAEAREARRRAEKQAADAAKQADREQAATQRERLKKATKAAGVVAPAKGTSSPPPPKAGGPARLPGEPVLNGVQVKRYPTPPGRFAVEHAPSVISSSECRPWAEVATA